jgi:hypothetical protein
VKNRQDEEEIEMEERRAGWWSFAALRYRQSSCEWNTAVLVGTCRVYCSRDGIQSADKTRIAA